jgi:hypothetical protein
MASTAASSPMCPETMMNGMSATALAQHLERRRRAEAGHGVVGDDHVPDLCLPSASRMLFAPQTCSWRVS